MDAGSLRIGLTPRVSGICMKKFSKAVIHLGGPKTGSTVLQRTLDASRQRLLREGIIAYPEGLWHAELGSCFASQPDKYVYNVLEPPRSRTSRRRRDHRYLQKLIGWLDDAPPCQTLVISYEGFPNLDPKGLDRLQNFCSDWAACVQAVFYVREPISYATSAYAQSIQFGILPKNPPLSDYHTVLQKITDTFSGNTLTVREWRPNEQSDWCVISDFLAVLGVNEAKKFLDMDAPSNRSISEEAVAFGKGIIRSLITAKSLLPASIFYEKFGNQLGLFPGDRFRLPHPDILRVQELSEEQNRYLTKNWGIYFLNPTISGSSASATYHSAYEKLGRHFCGQYLKNQPPASSWDRLKLLLENFHF